VTVLADRCRPLRRGDWMPGENAPRPGRYAVIGAGVLGVRVAARLAEAASG